MPKKWLITGGCGFIGTSLIKYLIQENRDTQIRVLDNLSVGTRDDLSSVCDFVEVGPSDLIFHSSELNSISSTVELIVGDITNFKTCLKCCKGVNVIVHLAANTGVALSVENPSSDMEGNVIGTFNLLEAARRHNIKRFVFASSGAPVGECEPPIHEELAPHPVSPYGASKLAGEGYCSAYYRTYGIETVALRFGNVYGPGSGKKNSVVAKFIKKALDGEILEIYGDGNQTRDFIYINDIVQAIWQAATVPGIGGETFQIATNAETTVTELAERLIRVLKAADITDVTLRKTPPRRGDVLRNYSDTTKARRYLGWQCRVALDDGLQNTLSWFIENRHSCGVS